MDSKKVNLSDIKKLRLERHWSQEQLAEMTDLSIRTIQRIENGGNASLESLKALGAVFETNITERNKEEEMNQIRKEEAYFQNIKGFYKLLLIAAVSLLTTFILAILNSFNWSSFLWLLFSWVVLLLIYSLNNFNFFGDKWKKKIIDKKFKK